MPKTKINTLDDFIKSIPNFPSELIEIPEASKNLLKLAYSKSKNLPKFSPNEPIKIPLIISFHPKLSLLNNNIHEAYLSQKIANKFEMIPLWIPYVYDTGYKTSANKIRLPTYVYMEGKYISIRASSKIRGNIMATEDPITEKEIKEFFQEVSKHEKSLLTRLNSMLNPINFGHYLFDLKSKITNYTNKTIQKRISELEKQWIEETKGCKKLAESLARISLSQFKDFGINVGLLMMDDVLQDISRTVFTEVLESPSIKKDPSILENLFIAYDLKTKERSPILYTGQKQFIAFNEFDVKVFEGNFDDLIRGLGDHTVIPTGHLIMTLFTAMGCKLVLGGAHTLEYYPDYFQKAYNVLKETKFNSKMQLLSYGKIRFIDMRNILDVLSAIRILDKVGSRNYIQNNQIKIPDDIVDHLNFLASRESVPQEYHNILDSILGTAKNNGTEQSKDNENSNQNTDSEKSKNALEKEIQRNSEIDKILLKTPDELLKDPTELKKWIPGTNFEGLHPVRLQVMLENLKADAEMRLHKMKENVEFEQHILGGTCGENIVYDGIINRSNRYPSLFELVYYKIKAGSKFDNGGYLNKGDSEWVWLKFDHQEDTQKSSSQVFKDYISVFDYLIPKKLLPDFMKF